jgi:hypothetical protein
MTRQDRERNSTRYSVCALLRKQRVITSGCRRRVLTLMVHDMEGGPFWCGRPSDGTMPREVFQRVWGAFCAPGRNLRAAPVIERRGDWRIAAGHLHRGEGMPMNSA